MFGAKKIKTNIFYKYVLFSAAGDLVTFSRLKEHFTSTYPVQVHHSPIPPKLLDIRIIKYTNIKIYKYWHIQDIQDIHNIQNIHSKTSPELSFHPWDPKHSSDANVQQGWELLCWAWSCWTWKYTGDSSYQTKTKTNTKKNTMTTT